MGGQAPSSGAPAGKMKTFDMEEAAGILRYDVAEVIKKTKVKDENQIMKIEKAFACYDDSLQRISFMLPMELMSLRDATTNMQTYAQEGNREKITAIMNGLEKIRPITQRYDDKLNADLKAILDKKQLKRWMSYQKVIKHEKMPPLRGSRGRR